jgi:uncharacterized protein YggT (Ycf19 family)
MTMVFHVLNGLKLLVVADALLSWGLSPETFPRSLTKALLDPVYAPLREAIGDATAPVDLSPLIALGVIFAIEMLLKKQGNREPT